MIHQTVLGIDASKDTLDCRLVMTDTERTLLHKPIRNNEAEIRRLLEGVDSSVPIVIEATGRYGLTLVEQARSAGRTVLLAPGRKAKAFLESIQSRAKTDGIDSFGLAMFGGSRRLPLYPLKSASVSELDDLLSYRKGLSGSIARFTLQSRSLPAASADINEMIAGMRRHLRDLDRRIAGFVRGTPEFASAARLAKVPGFGPVVSAALSSRLTHKGFTNPDQFVAYIGLDIRISQSGKTKGQMGLTRQGDAELRRLLYCAAQASLRVKGCPFHEQYDREIAKGHSHKQAACAVARKMAKLAWAMVRHGTEYDPMRVYVHPLSRQSAAVQSGGQETPSGATVAP